MANQTYIPRVERIQKVWTPDSMLYAPHEGEEIAFAYPAFSLNDYRKLGKEILSQGLLVPTGDHTASLMHAAYCAPEAKDKPEFQNARLHNGWLYVFNKDLWTSKGVYVVQDLKAVGLSELLDENELERMLKRGKEVQGIRFSKDKTVRFAPKGSYALGEHTPESFAKDGFIIASCKLEGAEKLGKASSEFRNRKPCVYGVEVQKGQQSVQRVSALDESFDGRLLFNGYLIGDGRYGRAFGVSCAEGAQNF